MTQGRINIGTATATIEVKVVKDLPCAAIIGTDWRESIRYDYIERCANGIHTLEWITKKESQETPHKATIQGMQAAMSKTERPWPAAGRPLEMPNQMNERAHSWTATRTESRFQKVHFCSTLHQLSGISGFHRWSSYRPTTNCRHVAVRNSTIKDRGAILLWIDIALPKIHQGLCKACTVTDRTYKERCIASLDI